MCGLIGAAGPGASALASRLDDAIDSIRHRGPDDSGCHLSRNRRFIVGHVRLAILGVGPTGRQPMIDAQDRVLAYNGEIYNHRSLRRDFGSSVKWSGSSDSETLLSLLGSEGLKALGSCEGMFAGAYFDHERDEVVLFRDTLGIKPLFVRFEPDGTVIFGSEIDALMALVGPSVCSVDGASLQCLLGYQNLPPGRSLFAGVRPLLPGEVLRVGNVSGPRPWVRSEWIDRPIVGNTDPVGVCDPTTVRGLVERSVESHLLSERPIGAYLSGGIDSTIVAGLAARSGACVEAFTGYFEPGSAEDDERDLARTTARRFGLNLNEVVIRPDHLISRFDDLMRHLAEPRMGTGTMAQFVVASEAAGQIKVVLAGHGGDELFGGYPIHQSALGIAQGRWLAAIRRTSGRRRAVTIWALLRYLRRRRLPLAPVIFGIDMPKSVSTLFESSQNEEELLASVDRYYRSIYLPGLLEVEDRISMAFGLETRLPLWTQPLVEEIFRMDPVARFGDRPKGLLRSAFDDLLPDDVKNAPKRGFPTPFAAWFRGPCREFIRERLEEWPEVFEEVIPAKYVHRIVSGHIKGRLPGPFDELRANRIWVLLQLATWARIFRPDAIVEGDPGIVDP